MKGGDIFMTEKTQKNEKHTGFNKVAAAGAGAVIGAGVAVAATAALKNPKTRAKLMDAFETVKDQAMEKIPHMMHDEKQIAEVKKLGRKVEKKVHKSAAKVKRVAAGSVKAPAAVN